MQRRSVRALVGSLFCAALCPSVGCSSDSKTPPAKTDGAADQKAQVTCTPSALLPADNAVGDFVRKGAVETATTAKELNDLIDGGSEKYTKQGKWICMARVTFKSATKAYELEVRLFDETDAAGAAAAYTDTARPDDKVLTPPVGEAARTVENTIGGAFSADMHKGRYVGRVEANQVTAKDDVLAMLAALAAKL